MGGLVDGRVILYNDVWEVDLMLRVGMGVWYCCCGGRF